MRKFKHLLFLVFIYTFSLNSYSEEIVEKTILKEDEVLVIAKNYISNTDIKIEEFYINSVLYNKEQQTWNILYLDKGNTIGGLFLLTIEDKIEPEIKITGGL